MLPILDQSSNPSPICQSITNLSIHHQSKNPMSIVDKSANPSSIRQSNPRKICQSNNPMPISEKSVNPSSICQSQANLPIPIEPWPQTLVRESSRYLAIRGFAKAGPGNYGRVNLACGTNGTEQRGGSKVVVFGCSRLSANESNYLSVHCNPWSYCNLNEIHDSIVKNDELALIFCFW